MWLRAAMARDCPDGVIESHLFSTPDGIPLLSACQHADLSRLLPNWLDPMIFKTDVMEASRSTCLQPTTVQ